MVQVPSGKFYSTEPSLLDALLALLKDDQCGLSALKLITNALKQKLDAPVCGLDALKALLDSILLDTGTTLEAKLDNLKIVTDAILVDTNTTLEGKLDAIKIVVDAILVDTNTTLEVKLDNLKTVTDAILVDTATTLEGKLDALALICTAARGLLIDRLSLLAAGGAGELTAARVGYLDNINNAQLLNISAAILGRIDAAISSRLATASYTAERGTDNAALAVDLAAHEASQLTSRGIVDNIILDTQIKRVASGTSGVIAGAASKYIEIDSGTNGAEILAVIINGVVGFDWTLDVYVPTADAVAAPAAADKRDSITYINTDTEGGLLKPFAIAYNAFLKFTNDSGGNQTVNDVVLIYRSRGAVTIGAWT